MSDVMTRITTALNRIEARLHQPKAPPVDIDAVVAPLRAQHEQLRGQVATAIAEIDALIHSAETH
jgi:hypothetical protein